MSYSDNPFVPQMLSPTAYEMGRFGRTPASHFYGLPNIAIPQNAITIKATYDVHRHDKKSYRSAHLATEFWNNRQDIYISPSGKQYVVNYELLVEDVNDISRFKQNNTYEVVKSFESQDRAGASARKRNIQVLESY